MIRVNANSVNLVNHVSAGRIVHMMNQHHVTIKTVAERLGVSQDRVRKVRERGVSGHSDACAWIEAITGAYRFSLDYHERKRPKRFGRL